MNFKQIKIEPRIKLNFNIYIHLFSGKSFDLEP